MKGFLSGIIFALVALLALFLAPEQSLFESLAARTFPTSHMVPNRSQQVAVFVTGCSSGIGLHAARYLASRGYIVFATVRRETDVPVLLQQEQQQQQQQQRQEQEQEASDSTVRQRIHPIICDVTDAEQIQKARETVSRWLASSDESSTTNTPIRVFGGIVNNAGMASPMVMFQNLPTEDLTDVLRVNLFGPFFVYQAFLPLIRQHKGRIINVGSVSGIVARPFRGPYTVSKFALEGFSDTIRQELMLEDISVSMINPGYIQTTIAKKSMISTHEKYGASAERDDLTADQRNLLEAFEAKYVTSLNDAPSPLSTSQAILHALTDPKPRTRYFPGSIGMGSVPAWMLPKIKQLLPDRIIDKVTVKATASKKETK